MHSGAESEMIRRTVLMSATVCQLTIQRVQDSKKIEGNEVTRLVLDQNSSGETSTIHAVLIY